LCTHHVEFAPFADGIIVVKEGRILHQGTHAELLAKGVDVTADIVQLDESGQAVKPGGSSVSLDNIPAGTALLPPGNAPAPAASEVKSENKEAATAGKSVSYSGVKCANFVNCGSEVDTYCTNCKALFCPRCFEVIHSFPQLATHQIKSYREYAEADVARDLTVAETVDDTGDGAGHGGAEMKGVGGVAYKDYMYAGGGPKWVILLVLLSLGCQGAQVASDVLLTDWSTSAGTDGAADNADYLYRYGLLAAAVGTLLLFRSASVGWFVSAAGETLHNNLLKGVLHAPMAFFDTTPSGRIINRMAKDQDVADSTLPNVVQDVFASASGVIGGVTLIIYNLPQITPLIAVVAGGYFLIQRYYRRAGRQLKAIEAAARSPMFSLLAASLHGLATIRAFKDTGRFMGLMYKTIDRNCAAYYYSFAVNRWLGIWLDVVGAITTLIVIIGAFLFRDSLGAAKSALAISSALSLTAILNWLIRQMSELELNMHCVERMVQYSTVTPEARWYIPETKPPDSWPQKGKVEFKNLEVRYRPELPPVLKQLTATLNPGEKIGVVGRTGAGKSTLSLAMLRIMEPSNGSVKIDGIDISTLGLAELRSKIAIIPQDPILFSGTLRSNLDPMNELPEGSDAEIMRVLEQLQLDVPVKAFKSKNKDPMQEGLNSPVVGLGGSSGAAADEKGKSDGQVEGGKAQGLSFSLGQRQLICLARAVLRKARIVIMDEATANLDFETDQLIRKFLREQLRDCTTLTIAHRLDTILDSDRIMVFDAGRLQEYDTPANLLANETGLLAGLLRSARAAQANADAASH